MKNFSFAFIILLLIPYIYLPIKYQEGLWQWWIKRTSKSDIVMLGDSHVNMGNWNSLLSGVRVRKEGYGGYDSEMIKRIAYPPRYGNKNLVILVVGANDLGRKEYTPNHFSNNVSAIYDTIINNGFNIAIHEIIYKTTDNGRSGLIDEANKILDSISKSKAIEFIEYPDNLFKGKLLKKEYSKDGVHLNEKGYEIWGEYLDKWKDKHVGLLFN